MSTPATNAATDTNPNADADAVTDATTNANTNADADADAVTDAATDATAALGHGERQMGFCKWFDKSKGFGFVQGLVDKRDYFTHHTQLSRPATNARASSFEEHSFRYLMAGEYVEFTVDASGTRSDAVATDANGGRADSRVLAVCVTGIHGGPLMFQTLQKIQPARETYSYNMYSNGPPSTYPRRVGMGPGAPRFRRRPETHASADGFTQVHHRKRSHVRSGGVPHTVPPTTPAEPNTTEALDADATPATPSANGYGTLSE